MHDSIPHYCSDFLPAMYGDCWIDRNGPHAWPSRSSKLNPLHYVLWKYLKLLNYDILVETLDGLRNRKVTGYNSIRSDHGVCKSSAED